MTRYGGPEHGNDYYESKFIRVENDIYVTLPDDLKTSHESLATQDGVYQRINAVSKQNPYEVDAGYFIMITTEKVREIQLFEKSATLGLPINKHARARSLVVFGEQTPGHKAVNTDR